MSADYLIWEQINLKNPHAQEITIKYDSGFLFTRTGKGDMIQTRSLRANLGEFKFNSENRRILKNWSNLKLQPTPLPLPLCDYSWGIHKLGNEYYSKKFGPDTFSANKIRQLITDKESSNFNMLMEYVLDSDKVGYAICYENNDLFHYAYPFYKFEYYKGLGMGMMVRAVEYAVNTGKKYLYLGSASKPKDRYKLQFENLEWFDGISWHSSTKELKDIIQSKHL